MLEDEIALLLDRLIRYAHSNLHQRAHLLHEEGMQPTDGMLLIALAKIEPSPIHELVDVAARHKSQITRTVKKLEAKGMIERTESPNDARVSVIKLSSKGRSTAAVLRNDVIEALQELLTPLSNADRRVLRNLLEQALDGT